jgi:hypothetical protein
MGGTPDDPNTYTQTGVQALEFISSETQMKTKNPQDEALNTLFSSSFWIEKLKKAREEVQLEKLARYTYLHSLIEYYSYLQSYIPYRVLDISTYS